MEVETIGSLMEQCGELTQYIDSERGRLERFMLETGGESDASERIQVGIGRAEKLLAEAENRLQVLLDAQEREAFAPEEKAVEGNRNTKGRTSMKKSLAEKKAEAAMRKPHRKERKSPGMDMER